MTKETYDKLLDICISNDGKGCGNCIIQGICDTLFNKTYKGWHNSCHYDYLSDNDKLAVKLIEYTIGSRF